MITSVLRERCLTLSGSRLNSRMSRNAAFLAAAWLCYLTGAALGAAAKYRWELRSLYIPVAVLMAFVVIDQLYPVGIEEERHQQAG